MAYRSSNGWLSFLRDENVRRLLDIARERLEDTYEDTYRNERFISSETVQRVFASKEIDGETTKCTYRSLADQLQLESSLRNDSLVLFAVVLLARLDKHYVPLVLKGLQDDLLFDEVSFRGCCQLASVPDDEVDRLRSSRNKFGAILCSGKRQIISKGVILPYLTRVKMDNGSFGVIYQVKVAPGHLRGSNETVVAEKQIRSSDYGLGNQEEWARLCREAITLEKRQHPNIIPLLTSYFLETEESETDIKTLHLISPWADKNLADWMACAPTPNSTENEQIRIGLFRQVYALVSGLSYLHRELEGEFTSHHDIKPSNILVFGQEFKLADFGNSHLHPSDLGSATDNNVLGTYEYQPPEYWDDNGLKAPLRHGRAFDAWAIGCVIIEVATLIVYGWSSQVVSRFRNARLESQPKRRPKLLRDERRTRTDNSFHNNMDVVAEWVENIKRDGSAKVKNLVAVAEGLMAENPRNRLYTWEAELDLYTIYDGDADRSKRLEHNALQVQHPPRKILNGISTPLHRAARTANSDRLEELLGHGWPLFVQDQDGLTPADLIDQDSHSIGKSCLKPYELYLGRGRTVQATSERERRAFKLVRDGDKAQLEPLLKEGIDWAVVDKKDHTIMHCALQSKHATMLDLILNFIDVDQLRRRDPKTGLTPLQEAATMGHSHDVLLIIDHLVHKQQPHSLNRTYTPDIEDRTLDGKTALFLALEKNDGATIEVLLNHEAQIFTQCKQGNTPVHAMASTEDTALHEELLARLLSKEEAAQCFEHRNRLGQTPIALALLHQNLECFRLLKTKGASIHTVNNHGQNLLHIMASMGHYAFMEQFINEFEPSAFEAEDHDGVTPSMVAEKSHNAKGLALLENRRPGRTPGRELRVSAPAADTQPNFYTLKADEPWLSWHKNITDFAIQFFNSWPNESVVRQAWKRLLRPRPDNIDRSTLPKPFVLAILYMLHLEQSLKLRASSGDIKTQDTISDKPFNALAKYDLWIGCRCSSGCGKEWNFANRVGMYRPLDEQTPPCKAVRALKERLVPGEKRAGKSYSPFRRKHNGRSCLEDMYQEWKMRD
ncbi:MAG: hypothetical protein Q9188_005787 [Gyalolechia gomerana]